jgi:ribonuclease R
VIGIAHYPVAARFPTNQDSSTVSEATTKSRQAIRQDILDFLSEHPNEAFRSHEIAQGLAYEDDELFFTFEEVLHELRRAGEVRTRGRKYVHRERHNQAVGKLSVTAHGYGFVQAADRDEEFFIREYNMGTALHGDAVRVALGAQPGPGKKRECEVIEVVERNRTQVVGTFQKRGHFAFVEPDDQRISQDIFVPQEAFNGAQDGEKVAVSIDKFEDRKASPEGRILRVIGPSDDPEVRVLSLAMSMDVRADFPEEVENEAEAIPTAIPQQEIDRRLDLRDKMIFTIDPEDAKDFDDAIHIDELPNGHYEVGVHIADVSHYVPAGTPIDDEGRQRATSVYLVDRTIPMLPEKLSNVVCSLRPNEDKLAFSCIMEVNRHGEVVDYALHETVIHSKTRLTYEQAQDYIDGGYPSDTVAEHVVRAARLGRTLTKKRMREGSIDFDLLEIKVILDDEGHPIDIVPKHRMEANRLIEEFMLLANRTVARHIADPDSSGPSSNGQPLPFLYRVHARPDPEKVQELVEYVKFFGYDVELHNGSVRSKDMNDLIQRIKGTPEEDVIERSALQTMSKAVYDVENIGHYGLGFAYYTHFTSPIRRYPDLVAHRLLKHYADGGGPVDQSNLKAICEHCSEQERNAVDAERESVKLKQVEYVQEHVGDTFDGVVSGVTKFGVFVQMTELLVEGLVHVRDMDDDYYNYDESTLTMTGRNTGKRYRPGDEVTVQIVGANVEKREVDLLFAD